MLAIDARARRALRTIDVLTVEASALQSKVRLKLASLASSLPTKVAFDASSALPLKVLSEGAARGEGSPRVEEAPAETFFERFRNLDLDAL
jgi:hypothetical protein